LKSDASTPEMVVDEPTPEPPPAVVEIDPSVLAEQRKEKGNDFFKAKKYPDAIDSYSDAIRTDRLTFFSFHLFTLLQIGLKPSEPNYLTNRAAALMALKRFHSALADCQQAASLQASSPVPKTLVRLARCQLALGSPQDCISTLTRVAQVEPNNAAAASLRKQADSLQKHLDSFLKAKAAKDWGMARIAFDTAVRECEGDIPIQWRCWRVELEIVRKKWDDAAQSASDALRLDPNSPDVLALRGLVLFLTNRLPQCIQHLQSALRLDPDHKVARVLLRRVKEVERIKELGNVEFKAGRMDEAVAKYGEALEVRSIRFASLSLSLILLTDIGNEGGRRWRRYVPRGLTFQQSYRSSQGCSFFSMPARPLVDVLPPTAREIC
jgi:DnaJ family protein C protein 7